MTNFEWLKAMDESQFADWVSKHFTIDDSQATNYFNDTYCENCEPIGKCAYCEINNKCKYFPQLEEVPSYLEICKIWLKSNHKEVTV